MSTAGAGFCYILATNIKIQDSFIVMQTLSQTGAQWNKISLLLAQDAKNKLRIYAHIQNMYVCKCL